MGWLHGSCKAREMGEDFSRYPGLVCTLVGILSIPISREKKMELGTINRLNFRVELELGALLRFCRGEKLLIIKTFFLATVTSPGGWVGFRALHPLGGA